MENTYRFQSEILYDLPVHQEFSRLTSQTYGVQIFFRFLTVLCVICFIPLFRYPYIRWLYLILCGVIGIPRLLQLIAPHKGDLAWDQTLRRNNGQPPRQQVTLDEAGIRSKSLTKNQEISDPYDQIICLMESKNLLLVMSRQRMIHVIDKRTLTGGTREDLIAHLRQHCPRLKKTIQTGKLHRIAEKVLWVSIILGLILNLSHSL